jgi:hypothetical protein
VKRTLLAPLLVVVAFVAWSQDRAQIDLTQPWHVLFYETIDQAMVDEVTTMIRAGYLPVGMELLSESGLAMLLVRGSMDNLQNWRITQYNDWNSLQTEIQGMIEGGLVPMAISRHGIGLSVLWVTATMEIADWYIGAEPNTPIERVRFINNLQGRGFTLWGISVYEDLVWMLFLDRPNSQQRTGTVTAFDRDAMDLANGINQAWADGWRPNGIALVDDAIYVCFSR